MVKNSVVTGGGSSVKSALTKMLKEREVNERLALFIGLLFANPVLGTN